MTLYGYIWSFMVLTGMYDLVLAYLVINGLVWVHMFMYGFVWECRDMYGLVLVCMYMFMDGHEWSFAVLYMFLFGPT